MPFDEWMFEVPDAKIQQTPIGDGNIAYTVAGALADTDVDISWRRQRLSGADSAALVDTIAEQRCCCITQVPKTYHQASRVLACRARTRPSTLGSACMGHMVC